MNAAFVPPELVWSGEFFSNGSRGWIMLFCAAAPRERKENGEIGRNLAWREF